jgi:hypothetical protein
VEKVWFCLLIPLAIIVVSSLIPELFLNGIQVGFRRIEMISILYKAHEREPKFHKNLIQYLHLTQKIFRLFFIFQAVIFHTPVIGGIFLSIWNGQFFYCFSFYVMFLDPDSLIGYIVNTTSVLISSILVFLGMVTLNQDHILFTTQVVPLTDIMCLKLEMFKKLIQTKSKKRTNRKANLTKYKILVEKHLRTFIKDHEKYREYANIFSGTRMKFIYFVIVSISSLAIGLSGFFAFKYSMFIGLSLFLVYIFNIAFFCVLGTLMEHQNKKLVNEFYDLPWHELSSSQQKTFLQMLIILQDANQPNTWIIGELNFETLKIVINTSYSYLTFLMNFS